MLSYLHAMGMHDTYEALRRETENDEFDPSDAKAKWVGLLEKKWTSVIRLQKKVSPLPAKNREPNAKSTDHGPRIP
jgi:platelet-activating factor acetylhydrolase IB subunit alpha